MPIASSPKKRTPPKRPSARAARPPKARLRTDIRIDMSRREAFLLLPLEERKRRIQAFIDAFAPAFADYSSADFREDQRREAENED